MTDIGRRTLRKLKRGRPVPISTTKGSCYMIHPPIEALLTTIKDRAAEAERGRHLPGDLVNLLRASGVFRLTVPAKYGGLQAPVQDLIDTNTAISAEDGATGWVTNIAATTAITSASMPEEHAKKIWSDPSAVVCGVTAPTGRALNNGDGTLTVNGRWSWASGSSFADWLAGGTIIDGSPEPRLVFFERSQYEILDTWHASGLRGTASNDFEVVDAVVPHCRSVGAADRPTTDAPLYAFPVLELLALGIAAVGLGIASRSIAELTVLADSKTPMGDSRSLASRSAVQRAVAQANAGVRSAQAYLADVVGMSWDDAVAGNRPNADARNELRLAATNAAQRSADAVDLMYNAGGGSVVHNDNPLQRCFRDIHVVTQHLMVAQSTFEVIGRRFLGLDAGTAPSNDGGRRSHPSGNTGPTVADIATTNATRRRDTTSASRRPASEDFSTTRAAIGLPSRTRSARPPLSSSATPSATSQLASIIINQRPTTDQPIDG